MPSVRTVFGLACAILAFTGAAAAGTPMPAPALPQLAALAFPGWSDSPAGRVRTVSLPPGLAVHGYANWTPGANRVLVEPRLVLRHDAAHLTLVAGLVPASEDGKPTASHLAPMALAAYQFTLHDGAWRLAGSQGVFAFRGFSGTAALRAVALSSRRQGLAVEYGSCWGGYCGTWLALYELKDGTVQHDPAVELALSGINVDSAADCQRRLQPLIKARPQDVAHEDGGAANAHDCYAIDGSWSIEAVHEAHGEAGDLILHYQGAISRGEAQGLAPDAIDQRRVLRYGDGKYQAVSGFDPVPPL